MTESKRHDPTAEELDEKVKIEEDLKFEEAVKRLVASKNVGSPKTY